ncbi:hypothetical protein ABZW30_33310 [Kitasatospora sp. NPDC004669]|uniref:hypothetical protein n=1 Tax=Kitasatospora sp. NPDC004669 TaxID=3154555 RepID=UPI0033B9E1F1
MSMVVNMEKSVASASSRSSRRFSQVSEVMTVSPVVEELGLGLGPFGQPPDQSGADDRRDETYCWGTVKCPLTTEANILRISGAAFDQVTIRGMASCSSGELADAFSRGDRRSASGRHRSIRDGSGPWPEQLSALVEQFGDEVLPVALDLTDAAAAGASMSFQAAPQE